MIANAIAFFLFVLSLFFTLGAGSAIEEHDRDGKPEARRAAIGMTILGAALCAAGWLLGAVY